MSCLPHGTSWFISKAGWSQVGPADNLRGHAHCGGVAGDISQHDTAGANLGSFADPDVADDGRPCTDQDTVFHLRVTVSRDLARAAERHLVQHRDIVAKHSGLTDHNSRRVIEQDAFPNPGTRVDIYAKLL